MTNSICYLCSAYSHPDAGVREQRFEAACRAAAALVRQGKVVYAPIVVGHSLGRYGLPSGWEFWQQYDLVFLAMCDEVIVLKTDDWQQSVGIQAEIAAARALGKTITFLSPSELGIDGVASQMSQVDAYPYGSIRHGNVDNASGD